jgi:hypothetical protein
MPLMVLSAPGHSDRHHLHPSHCRLTDERTALVTMHPFRAPHRTISDVG